jgi:group II intron reverse transcriptase/maturase
MTKTPLFEHISPQLHRVAKLAAEDSTRALLSLSHHIDLALMREAYDRTRKGATQALKCSRGACWFPSPESTWRATFKRFWTEPSRAPIGPLRCDEPTLPKANQRQSPKGDGNTRPLGIPTFEDKVLQRAIAMVLEAVYEQDFLDCSYGFRPGRSARDAVRTLQQGLMEMNGGWVVEVDIKQFFDTLDHTHLREILSKRIHDGVINRLVGKWLNAGVMEEGAVRSPESGTPQGGVISPILANVYLHEVLDTWFYREVQPRLEGQAFLIRYADDFVIAFSHERDARRVLDVLPKRFGKYGLALHEGKTGLVRFTRPKPDSDDHEGGNRSATFDFLGFTHYWAKSERGRLVVKQRTASDRFGRTLRRISQWCREHRHEHLAEQAKALTAKLSGHFAYFGCIGNYARLSALRHEVGRVWWTWLRRRSQRPLRWSQMRLILSRFALPRPAGFIRA